MAVSSTEARKLKVAAGTRMAFWYVGESLLIGDEIEILVLGVKDENVRLGVTTAQADTIVAKKSYSFVRPPRRSRLNLNKPWPRCRGRRRRGNHTPMTP